MRVHLIDPARPVRRVLGRDVGRGACGNATVARLLTTVRADVTCGLCKRTRAYRALLRTAPQ